MRLKDIDDRQSKRIRHFQVYRRFDVELSYPCSLLEVKAASKNDFRSGQGLTDKALKEIKLERAA